jgi:hypothetical protein
MKERHEGNVVETISSGSRLSTSAHMTVVVATATYGDYKRFETSISIK